MYFIKILFAIVFIILTSFSSYAVDDYDKNKYEAASKALKFVLSLDRPDHKEITALLMDEKFEEFERLSKTYEKQFHENALYESQLLKLFETMDGSKPDLEKKLNKWVELRPSDISYTARAAFYVSRAGYLRGGKWIQDTPEAKILAMGIYLDKAKLDLNKVIAIKESFLPAHNFLLKAEKLSGSKDERLRLLNRAIRVVPTTYYMHQLYLQTLQPRWGGSHAQMYLYSSIIKEKAEFNPRIWSLNGEVYADLADIAYRSKYYKQAIELYTKALSYGDRTYFLTRRAEIYLVLKSYELALADYKKIEEYDDQNQVLKDYIVKIEAIISKKQESQPVENNITTEI